ncbi:hypothetical protein [Enterobacter mori]|uniref:hypothetical protein n=1 Tax=Enterobacter mori TaxID=539813 RepID=UPI001B8BA3F5|nr:hypothetical protein [Enterobacter mori]MBS3046396.1 hypothetical protein [Enterobacter mori]
MRVLNVSEVEAVSGGWGFWSAIGASVLGAIMGTSTGLVKSTVSAGSTGGILGLGIVSALVGAVVGGIGGAIQGAAYGFVNDWDKTLATFNANSEQWADMTVPAVK